MINRIIDTIKKDGAVVFPPAEDRAIRFVGSMLSSHRFCPVPSNYQQLLKTTDGLVWNGVELYGCRAVDRDMLGYILPGLIEANMEFTGYEFLRGQIVLGRAAEEIFVYDARRKSYNIVDRHDFSITASFQTFSEAIYLFVDDLF
jgi:hypothetical protein